MFSHLKKGAIERPSFSRTSSSLFAWSARFDLYQALLNLQLTGANAHDYHYHMNLQRNTKLEQLCRVVGTVRPVRQPKTSSQALLGRCGELIIEHAGREYRLRLTQNGKLILTA